MTALEDKAIKTYDRMWATWSSPNLKNIEDALSFYSSKYHGFGSARNEKWQGLHDMRLFFIRNMNQNPGGYQVQTKWIEARQIDEKYVTLWGEVVIRIEQAVKTVIIDPMRITVLYRKEGSQMKIVQSHGSLPDVTQDGEIWPGTGAPKKYEEASILFTDFVGFTKIMENMSPDTLVNELNEIFAGFDKISLLNGLEKVKTIGDSYMAAGGLYDQDGGQAKETVRAAKEMIQYLRKYNKKSGLTWKMRIGIHSGPVIGGVIGTEKLRFDLWGETVNRASRIESTSKADKINVSAYTYDLIKDHYQCEYRGKIETKDKDLVDMYFVI